MSFAGHQSVGQSQESVRKRMGISAELEMEQSDHFQGREEVHFTESFNVLSFII